MTSLSPDDKTWIEGLIKGLSNQLDRSEARVAELTNELVELKVFLGEAQTVNRSLQRQVTELKEEIVELRGDCAKKFVDVNKRCDDEDVHRDDLEQYGRRMSVRIQNVPIVAGEDDNRELLLDEINRQLAGVDMKIERSQIIRYHRSSKPKDGASQCLVKLRSWDKRAELHNVNRKARDLNKRTRVYHDLTKRRLTCLNQARDELGDRANKDRFVYADINSSLMFRTNGKKYRFNTLDEFKVLLVQA